jgi:hypothetical protein
VKLGKKKLRLCENNVLRIIFGTREVTSEWIKLNKEELHGCLCLCLVRKGSNQKDALGGHSLRMDEMRNEHNPERISLCSKPRCR